jgi:hypothetical protein
MTVSTTCRSIGAILFVLICSDPHAAGAEDAGAPPDDGPRSALVDVVPLRYPPLTLSRDPFARPASFERIVAMSSPPAPLGDPGFALPPNAGAPPFEAASVPLGGATVQAVITGGAPRALLQIGTSTTIVGLGSRVGAASIVKIDGHGIQLSDGTRLSLAGPGR